MYMPVSDDDRAFARELLAEVRNRQSGGRLAALCPATTWPNKHWTEEGWADLADGLVRDWDMLPMFMGAHADIPMIDRIRDRAGCETFNLAGRTTLKQAAAMLEQSDLVVGVDTGLLHIAVALNRPGIGIFGPSGWQHFVIRDTFMPLAKEFPCIPCFRHPTCRDYDCMKAITPQDVLQAVHQLFDRTRHVHGEKAVVDPGQDRGCNET
jgi:heptosyltransferase-1